MQPPSQMNINPLIKLDVETPLRTVFRAYPSCYITMTEYDPETVTETYYSTYVETLTVDPTYITTTEFATETLSIYNTYTGMETLTYTETIGTETCVCTYTVCTPCITETVTIQETIAITSVITEYETYTPQIFHLSTLSRLRLLKSIQPPLNISLRPSPSSLQSRSAATVLKQTVLLCKREILWNFAGYFRSIPKINFII